MEIGKRLNPRYIFFGLYFIAFFAYIVVGLQPAEATNYNISTKLVIPSIELDSDVATLKMENHQLSTPDTIVGSYSSSDNKTMLIGHSSTVFNHLNEVSLGDEIIYDDARYVVKEREILPKEDVIMPKLLSASNEKTIVIMTCAGEDLGKGDATHRLILTAIKL